MVRVVTLILVLIASPSLAAGPAVSISGASAVGVPGLPQVSAYTGAPCRASGLARIYVTFTDPDGITYAAVNLNSVGVRPAVSAQDEAWLWVPSYARPKRGYQWRYEDLGATRTRHTIPITIDLVPGARPILTEIMAKDGSGALRIRTFALVPDACG
jgi:hypothetical protein